MIRYILNRLMQLIPTFIGVSVIAFGLIRLVPGDPVLLLLGERGASPEVYAEMQAKLGLDKSVFQQYVQFVSHAFQGDLGSSIVSRRPILEEFFSRFPATLELGLLSLFWATLLGIPLGVLAAIKRNSVFDYTIMGGSLVGYSMPIFWWGLLLIMFFSSGLGWTPVSGRISPLFDIPHVTGFLLIDSLISEDGLSAFYNTLHHLILPVLVLGTIPLAIIARMTRSSMLEVIREDYIRTAKAKGMNQFGVIFIHALRNAMIPVITVIGLILGTLVTGAILTETIFSWPGIGKWMVASVSARDYPVIQGGILIIATFIITINLCVDLLYAVINPRIRK